MTTEEQEMWTSAALVRRHKDVLTSAHLQLIADGVIASGGSDSLYLEIQQARLEAIRRERAAEAFIENRVIDRVVTRLRARASRFSSKPSARLTDETIVDLFIAEIEVCRPTAKGVGKFTTTPPPKALCCDICQDGERNDP